MPKLSELTDYSPEPEVTPSGRLYVSPNMPTSEDGDYFTKPVAPMPELPADNIVERIIKKLSETEFSGGTDIGNKLAGTGGQERYQLWPEKIVRSALTAIPDAYSGKIPMHDVNPETGELEPSQAMIGRAMDMASFAGVGGMGGTGEGGLALGAGPSLRPALKYKDRLYKGKEGQQHMDVIPPQLYPEFQKMAMSGEDISHYNFGFVNDKGHFLSREDALKYGIDSGLIDPQAGKFGALTSTLMADSSKPGTAIEAMAKTAQPFYSALEHNVDAISQNKMNGEAWLGTLANKPGVKPEELDWTGLRSFLEENKGKPVTKEQVQEHLASNKVELKEVSKFKEPSAEAQRIFDTHEKNLDAIYDKLDAQVKKDFGGTSFKLNNGDKIYSDELSQGLFSGDIKPNDVPASLQPIAKELADGFKAREKARDDLKLSYKDTNKSKYHSYQLPGGENYREMLMTLPDKAKDAMLKRSDEIFTRREKIQDRFDELYGKDGLDVIKERKQLTAEFNTLTDELQKINLARNDKTTAYKSSHWDEPNILAHVRMNDRTIDGKKSLHVEEIQSDWHQQGRDRGYKGEFKETPYIKPDDLKIVEGPHDWSVTTPSGKRVAVGKGVEKEEIGARDYLTRHINSKIAEANSAGRIAEADRLPDAPFKKTWHELALKRMLREAAEKGYDRLSWTPGEAQAARYDLSKSIDKLTANPTMDQHGVLKYEIKGWKGDNDHLRQFATESELPNIVGKEMAKKIVTETEGKKPVSYSGLDLKVGGEGMKGFYDQIIPKSVNKLAKEYGAKVEVGKTKEGHSVFYIDLPQKLKDTAMGKGFPLFSSGLPYKFTPVDFDPFEDKKK